jgi:hypothetical protein
LNCLFDELTRIKPGVSEFPWNSDKLQVPSAPQRTSIEASRSLREPTAAELSSPKLPSLQIIHPIVMLTGSKKVPGFETNNRNGKHVKKTHIR